LVAESGQGPAGEWELVQALVLDLGLVQARGRVLVLVLDLESAGEWDLALVLVSLAALASDQAEDRVQD